MSVNFRCGHCGDVLNVGASTGESQAATDAMARMVPTIISIFFHMGLALVMVFFGSIVGGKHAGAAPQEIITPQMTVIDDSSPRNFLTPTPMQNRRPAVRPAAYKPANTNSVLPSEGIRVERIIIKADPTTPAYGTWTVAGGPGPGTGQGGPGTRGFGTAGGNPDFLGRTSGKAASHFVYVIDRSGSMVDTFDAVRSEVLNSVRRLGDSQDFHVILFSNGPPLENPPKRLVPASMEQKLGLVDFMDAAKAAGKTDPVPALQRAFDVLQNAAPSKAGKVIFLLTDGAFPDNDKVMGCIRERNARKDVVINTYLYGSRQQGEAIVQALGKIAADNGGTYKAVDAGE